jgi:hypothetical protein
MYVAITTCQSAKSLSRKGTILADQSRSKVTVLFVADSDQLNGMVSHANPAQLSCESGRFAARSFLLTKEQ